MAIVVVNEMILLLFFNLKYLIVSYYLSQLKLKFLLKNSFFSCTSNFFILRMTLSKWEDPLRICGVLHITHIDALCLVIIGTTL